MKKMNIKNTKPIISFILVIYWLIVFSSFCQAGSGFDFGTKDVGGNSSEFLKIGVGARPCAMGEVFVSVADDSNAIYWNPSALGKLKSPEVSLMHLEWFSGVNYESLSYIQPIGLGTVGLNVSYLQKSGIERVNASSGGRYYKDGSFTFSDMGVTVSYGRELINDFYGGGSLKFIGETIDQDRAYGAALDGGIFYLYHPWSFGFTVQNIGSGIKFGEERFALPFCVRMGGSYRFFKDDLIVGLESALPAYGRSSISLGGEYWFFEMMAFRVGYKHSDGGWSASGGLDELNGLTGGIGIKLSNSMFKIGDLGINYAFVPYGDFGNTHRISMNYRWGRREH